MQNQLVITANAPVLAISDAERMAVLKLNRTLDTIRQDIEDACASSRMIGIYLQHRGDKLSKVELRMVEYALARAYMREEKRLTLSMVALLAQQSMAQIKSHIAYLGLKIDNTMSTNDASRILCRLMEA